MGASVRASTSNSGSSGTASANKPTGTSSNDVLLAFVHTNGPRTTSDGNGTTPFTDLLVDRTYNGPSAQLDIYKRIAKTTEPASYSFPLSASDRWSCCIVAIKDADTSTIFDVTPSTTTENTGTSSLNVTKSLVTTTNGCIALSVACNDSNTVTFGTTPSGWDVQANLSGQELMAVVSKYIDVAGTVGSITFNQNTSNGTWLNNIFSIKQITRGWYNTNWLYRQKITIDSTKLSADVVNFPVYLNLGLLGTTFFNSVGSAGADIRLTKSDGTTELAREIVSVGTATGEVHFNSGGTISSTQDTDFYIYYGNGTATDYASTATYGKYNTWDSNFVSVHHLQGTTDSCSNQNNIVSNSGTSTTGKIENAYNFVSSGSNRIEINDANSLDLSGSMTLEAWIKPQTVGDGGIISKNNNALSSYNYIFWLANTNEVQLNWLGTGVVDRSFSSNDDSVGTTNQWYYVAASKTFGVDDGAIYVNGSSRTLSKSGTQTTAVVTDANPLSIGSLYTNGHYFNGIIDEARISKSVRSSAWLSATYNNINSPATFYTIGNPEIIYKKSLSDTITISDITNRAVQMPRNITDSISITDTLKRVLNYRTYLTDSITLTDFLKTETQISIALQDTLSVSDSINLVNTLNRKLQSTLTTSDNLDISVAYNRSEQFSINVTDSLDYTFIINRVLNDSISIQDTIDRALKILGKSIASIETIEKVKPKIEGVKNNKPEFYKIDKDKPILYTIRKG